MIILSIILLTLAAIVIVMASRFTNQHHRIL